MRIHPTQDDTDTNPTNDPNPSPTAAVSRRHVLAGGAAAVSTGMFWNPLGTLPARAEGGAGPADDHDVLYQTSFEDSGDTAWLSEATAYDTDQAYTGVQSLKYTRTDPEVYVIARRSVPFEPGRTYQASVFLKAEGLSSPSAYHGARIGLEIFDATGKWIRGGYSAGSNATDWELRTATIPDVDQAAAEMVISLYIYRGQTGTVWFDELKLTAYTEPAMTTFLRYPSYRGLLIPGDHHEVDLQLATNPDRIDVAAHKIDIAVVDDTGTIVHHQELGAAEPERFTVPVADLPLGELTLRARLVPTAGGDSVVEDVWPMEKLAEVPDDYLDAHGRMFRDGELFFPIGFYAGRLDDTTYSDTPSVVELAGTPFNTMLAYSPPTHDQLDLADANGIKVIYALNSFYYDAPGQYHQPPELVDEADEVPVIIDTVNEYKDHPAMLGWYMGDELQVDYFGPRMVAHHQAVIANDSRNVTLHVAPRALQPATYARSCDAFGIDNYPVRGLPTDDMGLPGRLAREAAAALPGRGFWHVGQSFSWGVHGGGEGRSPSLAEITSMYWQLMVSGATGLLLYQLPVMHLATDQTFETLLGNASSVAQHIIDTLPILFSIQERPEATPEVSEAISWTTREHAGAGYLLSVSSAQAAEAVAFTVPSAMSVEIVDRDRTLDVSPEGRFTDSVDALGLTIYRLVHPTYASLGQATRDAFEAHGSAAGPGIAAACVRLLDRAADAGRPETSTSLVDAYRRLVVKQAGTTLGADDVARLSRLANHVR
ncbi:hypothetical protein [Microlunatus sp. Y2014]|uniref:hypothetical protein n=1 Tax=Microlunatus sp. Y2014 TaxID=3418488 RepID=UPI003DA752AE